MEIFGIGPLELLLIVMIALIVLGPKEMMNSAKKAAEWIRKIRNSELWSSTKEVMDIPKQVIHESGLDKEIQELQSLSNKKIFIPEWKPSPPPILGTPKPADPPENSGEPTETAKETSPLGISQEDQPLHDDNQ